MRITLTPSLSSPNPVTARRLMGQLFPILLLLPALAQSAEPAGAAANPDATSAPDLHAANLRAVDEYILPNYRTLAKNTALLENALAAFCEHTDSAHLRQTEDAFQTTMDAWQKAQTIRFGPAELFLRHDRIQHWPDPHGTAGRQLAALLSSKDDQAISPEGMAAQSVAVQGLGALEELLFNRTPEQFRDANGANFRCRMAAAIGANLRQLTQGLLDDWQGGRIHFRQVIESAPNGNDYFYNAQEVTARLLNNLHRELQAVADIKLGRVLDDPRLNPKRAESWRSRRSLANIRLNLESTRAFYRITFAPMIQDPGVHQRIEAGFEAALRAASAISTSLFEAVSNETGRKQLSELRQRVTELRMLIGEQIPAGIGVPLGFNNLDGD